MQSIASLYSLYCEAGFAEETFWTLTPRRYLIVMRGAQKRRAERIADTAEAAWVGFHVERKDLDRYCAALRGEDLTQPPEALGSVLTSASTGMAVVSWPEYLAQRKDT
ncbi:hypothetical protein TG4357_02653 [Thalassovita gelatinovora]|uniref:Uncharacterized protein n=1 Tax=Thalassovita gelatinovora TaxID=53501 RepID=A0A0N7LVN7_THAGE|nr:hypothetical protein [Thalassovita gelatinovora]QIZ79778.1 hypothetical protein HFZ77_04430 [Thalassovita gelatinovora]CUH66810.1 hypothetical protein TG4357_02653 [Thalassovita gelatinovora]SEQ43183.1 hypothetical protein SAMN04488043_105190 [Thalassovita gelatinovora]